MNSGKQSTNLQMTLREVNRVGEGQKNVPKLRFKGYEDAWEQRKFMECINNVVDYRGKTPKKLGMNWAEEGFLALSALNVKDGYIDFELDANYGDIELYNAWMKQDLSKGQVVFTTEAPMGNVAQIPDKSKYILSQRVIAFEVAHEKITDDFLATLLKSPKVFDDLTSLATGGTAKGVSQKSLSKLSVKIPQIIEEQNKIAKIICTLNKAITLHQRKYDALKSMKKTLLSKMFPKNGEDVPEIRFKEFTDAWEQRKLGEIVLSEIKGSAKAEMIGGDTPYLETNYLNGGECLFVDSENNVDTDDVIVLWDGSQAGTVYHGFSGALGSTFKAYKTKCLGLFIFQQLKKNQQTIYDKYRTPNIPHVIKTFKDEYDVMLTSEEEQNEIGRYFQQIDHLITLHQRKLEELKNMKKTLLQQMFV